MARLSKTVLAVLFLAGASCGGVAETGEDKDQQSLAATGAAASVSVTPTQVAASATWQNPAPTMTYVGDGWAPNGQVAYSKDGSTWSQGSAVQCNASDYWTSSHVLGWFPTDATGHLEFTHPADPTYAGAVVTVTCAQCGPSSGCGKAISGSTSYGVN